MYEALLSLAFDCGDMLLLVLTDDGDDGDANEDDGEWTLVYTRAGPRVKLCCCCC